MKYIKKVVEAAKVPQEGAPEYTKFKSALDALNNPQKKLRTRDLKEARNAEKFLKDKFKLSDSQIKKLTNNKVAPRGATGGQPEQQAFEKWLSARGGKFGKKGASGWTEGKQAWSYNTIIGKIDGDTLYLNKTKYSSTTSKLQSFLRTTAKATGMTVTEKDEDYFGTSMPVKLEMGQGRRAAS